MAGVVRTHGLQRVGKSLSSLAYSVTDTVKSHECNKNGRVLFLRVFSTHRYPKLHADIGKSS